MLRISMSTGAVRCAGRRARLGGCDASRFADHRPRSQGLSLRPAAALVTVTARASRGVCVKVLEVTSRQGSDRVYIEATTDQWRSARPARSTDASTSCSCSMKRNARKLDYHEGPTPSRTSRAHRTTRCSMPTSSPRSSPRSFRVPQSNPACR